MLQSPEIRPRLAAPGYGRVRLELHPFAAAGLGLAALALIGWSGAVSTYALFRDDVLIEIQQRHRTSERMAEDRIAELKAEIDRLNTKHLVERETFLTKMRELSRHQADLERRQNALSELAGSASAAPAAREAIGGELRLNRVPDPSPLDVPEELSGVTPQTRLLQIQNGQARIGRTQSAMLDAIENRAQADKRKIDALHAALGLPASTPEPVKAAMGGPFIPLGTLSGDSFAARLDDVTEKVRLAAKRRKAAELLPVRHPARGAPITSTFGGRSDPFIGAMAFHSGMDFALDTGMPVAATGGGKVVEAGWNGGYGMMVEIDHGRGLSTRYAHLSAIAVTAGQTVRPGQKLGRAGSTGRSTGAHLHYETRLNGRAIDPARFIAAGRLLDRLNP